MFTKIFYEKLCEFIDSLLLTKALPYGKNTLMHYICMYGDKACITNIKAYYQKDIRVTLFSNLLKFRNNEEFTPLYMAVVKNNLRALHGFTQNEITTTNQLCDRLPAVYEATFRMDYVTIQS